MPEEPIHAALEIRKARKIFGVEYLDGKKRNETHHRAHLHGNGFVSRTKVQDVIVKTILLVPEANSLVSHVVHGQRNINEMLEEFTGDILVCGILVSQFHSH